MRWVWIVMLVAALGVFFALEIPAIANRVEGDTLSEVLRWIFHTHTTPGRAVWLTLWTTFATWFAIHIAWEGTI